MSSSCAYLCVVQTAASVLPAACLRAVAGSEATATQQGSRQYDIKAVKVLLPLQGSDEEQAANNYSSGNNVSSSSAARYVMQTFRMPVSVY